jgi:plasmid stabilization system protein ParE
MKRYKVILHPDAELDIASPFKRGCRAWGEENAKLWVQKLRRTLKKQLTSMPFACPLAPESEQLSISVRHLIVERYRILFTVTGRIVTILHVRGPYIARVFIAEYRSTNSKHARACGRRLHFADRA